MMYIIDTWFFRVVPKTFTESTTSAVEIQITVQANISGKLNSCFPAHGTSLKFHFKFLIRENAQIQVYEICFSSHWNPWNSYMIILNISRLENNRIFLRTRATVRLFERKVWSECKNCEGECGETRARGSHSRITRLQRFAPSENVQKRLFCSLKHFNLECVTWRSLLSTRKWFIKR